MASNRPQRATDTEIVKKCQDIEMILYRYSDAWKRKYRYTLIEELIKDARNLRKNVITAFSIAKEFKREKKWYYSKAKSDLEDIEALLFYARSAQFNIMSNSEYADIAILKDDIEKMIEKLLFALEKYSEVEQIDVFPDLTEVETIEN